MITVEGIIPIVIDTTTVYRNGEAIAINTDHNFLTVYEVYGYPPAGEIPPYEQAVDMVFVTVGVDTAKAEANRARFMEQMGDGVFGPSEWADGMDMKDGPSYIHLGGYLGSQEMALRFMALGHVLGVWSVTTAALLGITDPADIKAAAGRGFLYAMGWSPTVAEAWQEAQS